MSSYHKVLAMASSRSVSPESWVLLDRAGAGTVNPRMTHIAEGGFYLLEDDDKLPYKHVRHLGSGGDAYVEEVLDRRTGLVYARKFFRINCSQYERSIIFENEIRVIQRLNKHRHVIRVFASYVAKREVDLVLSPVASRGSLDSFLRMHTRTNSS